MERISEEAVKGTAEICGPHSAAAQALADAEKRRAVGQEVAFFRARGSIVVVGTAKPGTEST
jgi:hypothetical protein